MPQTSDGIEIEDLDDHVDDASGNEGEDFGEGEKSANELGYGSLEDDILDESESEAGGEGDGEREDGEVGQKQHKNTQGGQRKPKYRCGYSKRCVYLCNICTYILLILISQTELGP